MSTVLDQKYAERDALLDWLQALAREDACPEARIVVEAQLDRVRRDIKRLQEN